ncbi:PKD domain-containing protein [Diaminobutyricimonas sp. TR449]|uniref:PKD domain-containing protein n=1 Tax=Diaminobutyricimonas sp. TR449 TaxID=2708076 RepID=UPI00142029A4|nr:PKD domain-containing protein [Diaminobutyricimonas sp. TR449]
MVCDIGYSTPLGGTPPTEPADPAVGRAITLSDIASFRASAGNQAMEPDGWIVVGLDTNFYASASQHTRSGSLLGRPAEVRFTPVAYRWHYGDGTGQVVSTPGASWSTQGLPEFSPTPTSHVYAAPGSYVITLTVHFSAEYRWAGSGWTPISGTLAVPANELVATAGDIRTVLVAQHCAQNPSGPGC